MTVRKTSALPAAAPRREGKYLTCVDGPDGPDMPGELVGLVGDVHTQSGYIDLPHPLAEAKR
ncbi:hypothetical protein ACFRMN_10165 [Streptomyces sp. NPDC056835]|uniref:hypothetical protein n=1 Tax=Streptomyces sp. NPDC056835 TaxID=3345956 RepID=UPI003692468A